MFGVVPANAGYNTRPLTCHFPSFGMCAGYAATVAGLPVHTGDLLVADVHGVLRIPPEIPIEELVEAGREIDRLESEIFACTRAADFGIEKLERTQESVLARWPDPNSSRRGNQSRSR